jgi:hypothetical protein
MIVDRPIRITARVPTGSASGPRHEPLSPSSGPVGLACSARRHRSEPSGLSRQRTPGISPSDMPKTWTCLLRIECRNWVSRTIKSAIPIPTPEGGGALSFHIRETAAAWSGIRIEWMPIHSCVHRE